MWKFLFVNSDSDWWISRRHFWWNTFYIYFHAFGRFVFIQSDFKVHSSALSLKIIFSVEENFTCGIRRLCSIKCDSSTGKEFTILESRSKKPRLKPWRFTLYCSLTLIKKAFGHVHTRVYTYFDFMHVPCYSSR